MIKSNSVLEALSNRDLLAATREILQRGCVVEAELLAHLGEIDDRRLFLDLAFPSMFAFCMGELGFSEDAAWNRMGVARAGRQFPAVIEALRSGQIHLSGLRLLVPRLTTENQHEVLAQAVGKSKRQIEELVARLAPQPPVPASIRKVPQRLPAQPDLALSDGSMTIPPCRDRRPVIAPLAEDTFKVQFTASRRLRDKLRQAQDLLRHRVPDGDLATVIEKAVDSLIEQVKKERFATGRKPRPAPAQGTQQEATRHVPDAIRRAVFQRDGGRCTFTDERGRRCEETGGLEFDHVEGFARTHLHEIDKIRLLCRHHNQHAAERLYGRAFMQRARTCHNPAPPDSSDAHPSRLPIAVGTAHRREACP